MSDRKIQPNYERSRRFLAARLIDLEIEYADAMSCVEVLMSEAGQKDERIAAIEQLNSDLEKELEALRRADKERQ